MCLPFSLAFGAKLYRGLERRNGIVAAVFGRGVRLVRPLAVNKGMSRVPANVSGLLISLEPVVGVLLAVLILGKLPVARVRLGRVCRHRRHLGCQ